MGRGRAFVGIRAREARIVRVLRQMATIKGRLIWFFGGVADAVFVGIIGILFVMPSSEAPVAAATGRRAIGGAAGSSGADCRN
jgi:hypothetical protein